MISATEKPKDMAQHVYTLMPTNEFEQSRTRILLIKYEVVLQHSLIKSSTFSA